VADHRLIFIVGLTGVGKSSTLDVLRLPRHITLLPNRRVLTDEMIIPQAQQQLGEPVVTVSDRLERFRLTAAYRELFPGGVVHALSEFLASRPELTGELMFDNIRGLQEVQAALEAFRDARFIVLDAPPLVRLKRLIIRADSFDKVGAVRLENTAFLENLLKIDGIAEIFDPYAVARLEAETGAPDTAILNAARIIVTEQRHYASQQASGWLESHCSAEQLLRIDTADRDIAAVRDMIEAWL
jgi:dephospho-CoA kinase